MMKAINKQLNFLHSNYDSVILDEHFVNKDPVHLFKEWMEDALEMQVPEPNAMILATASKSGKPSVRTLLLRDFSEKGFVFYTNYNSRKGKEIDSNPHGSLLFYWPALQRQIRIDGSLEKIIPIDSENYFKTRPLGVQISAWVSPQSAVIDNKYILEENFKNFKTKYTDKTIPYPNFWGGYCLKPETYEFWQNQSNGLHDRIEYCLENDNWKIVRLAP